MTAMTEFSVLDLVSVPEGGTASSALHNSATFARLAEELDFKRFWVAEHHGMPGIASAATAVVLAHIGAATSRIRIGSGGIMLPNHSPLIIAEQFGTLEALFPNRVDLGVGRAPGSDGRVAAAIRRDAMQAADHFPDDVVALQAYFAGSENSPVIAVPGAGANIEMWILGSSLFGAHLAAMLGMPYAFASHFAPQAMEEAIAIYRAEFRPSATLAKPHVMLAYSVYAADTDEEAQYLASSMEQTFVSLWTGKLGKVAPPVAGYRESLPMQAQAMLRSTLRVSAIGTKSRIVDELGQFLDKTQADEIIINGSFYDHEKRCQSLHITAEAIAELKATETVAA
jgi:luciferase family oxidoreductase group 1